MTTRRDEKPGREPASPSLDRFAAELESSTDVIARLVGGGDVDLPIPTCPDWTLRHLATHVGRAHRWAAEIVRTRSAAFIPFREVPDGKFPADPAAREPWLRAGQKLVTAAVGEAGRDVVWTMTGPSPASFWARRMSHETMVHRVDAQLAAGLRPQIFPDLAADAIDEWLGLLSGPAFGQPDPRSQALAQGAVLHVHATDPDLAGSGEWLIRHGPEGVTVETGHGKGDAAITGPAASLLLVLVRRQRVADADVTVHGDVTVLTGWLDGTPY